jgi:hypothetical protein
MKPSRFTEELIVGIVQEQEAAAPTADIIGPVVPQQRRLNHHDA